MAIKRKLKTCKDCGQQKYLFSKGRCENCAKIADWKRSDKEKKRAPKVGRNQRARKSPEGKSARQLLIQQLDRKFSEFIRLRDTGKMNGCPCISSGKYITYETSDAGHFIGRGNMAVRWDERNVNAQGRQDNRFREGNRVGYIDGIKKKYGEGIVEELQLLSKIGKGPDTLQMRAMLQDYTEKVKDLRKSFASPVKKNDIRTMNKEAKQSTPDLAEVLTVVSEVTEVSVAELKSRNTGRRVLNARKLFMFLADRYTEARKIDIGEIVGRKYNSVANGLSQVPGLCESDPAFNYNFENADNRLKSGYNGIWTK